MATKSTSALPVVPVLPNERSHIVATKSTPSTQEAAAPSDTPAGEFVMHYNDQVAQHPRYHQPGDPDAADATVVKPKAVVKNSDIKPQPADMTAPKDVVKKAEDVDAEIAKRPDTGDLGDTGK